VGLLLALLALARAAGPAWGQAAAPEFYAPYREFKIPFEEPTDRRIQRVLLHASEDSGRTWQYVAAAAPTDRAFRYQAPRDGWFWFTTQTQDQDGHLYPADRSQFQPRIKVCVDTQRPTAALRQVAPREGTVAVEWDVQDENLDLGTLRIEYRPLGSHDLRDWLPLRPPPVARGSQGWTPPRNIPLEVHLEVRDRAGNVGEMTLPVTPGNVPAGNVPGAGGGAAGGAPTIHVKSRNFQLECKITNKGDSGVQGIDVYVLRDNVWRKFTPKEGQYKIEGDVAVCSVTVEAAGRWGFTLLPRSGVGLAEPAPRPGDAPQLWVEVDETRPTVILQNVVVGQGPDLGKLTVYYNASDTYLKQRPITISHAPSPTGPWTTLAAEVENTGVYTVDTKGMNLPFQFFLKVDAADEAGNVGSAQTPQTVKIDTRIPKAVEVKVRPPDAGPAPATPLSPGN
jgi:hypothetical protein